MSACPPLDVLDRLISGRLDADEAPAVEAHVEGCPACHRLLDELTPLILPPGESVEPGSRGDDKTAIDRLKVRRPLVFRRDAASYPGGSLGPVLAQAGAENRPAGGEADEPERESAISSFPRIAGFEIVREVGRGGMGIVYEAIELALGRRVALKVLPPLSADATTSARFRREARAAGRLHHTNIVPIFGVGECGGLLYYAMQFIDGEGLDGLIGRLRSGADAPSWLKMATESSMTRDDLAASPMAGAGPAPAAPPAEAARFSPSSGASRMAHARVVARIGLQVAEALDHAHNGGFLHRDIKPSNILIDGTGTAWVADFGLAKGAEPDEALTQSGDIVGTLRYMPPERFAGRSDARGDVYALGVTLYELLTLRPVFEDYDRTRLIEQVLETEPVPPRQLDRRVPRDLETVISKAMAKDPAARYATAGKLADDLRRFLEGRPITARRVGASERLVRWARRRPVMASLCAAVTVLAVSLLGLGAWSYVRINHALSVEAGTRKEMERLSADLLLDRGIELAEDREVGRGLFWMHRSLDVAPAAAEGARRAARANLAAWRDQAIVPKVIRPTGRPILSMAMSPDGRMAVTGHVDGTIRSWDMSTGTELMAARAHESGAAQVSFRPDGLLVASSAHHLDPTTRLWDARTLRPIGAPMRHAPGAQVSHVFRPDGALLVTYSPEDGAVRVWDGSSGRPLAAPLSHAGVVHATFSPDGRHLATVGQAREARLWDVATGQQLGEPLPHGRSIVWRAAFSPDGRRLATVDGDFQVQGSDAKLDGRVRIWDIPTGRLLGAGPAVRPGLWTVVFHPDGRKVVAGGFNGFALIYDAETAEPLGVPMMHSEWVRQIGFSPDGRMTLTASADGAARLFDAETGRSLGSVMEHGSAVEAAGFGPDGRTIVTVSHDGSLRVWDGTAADLHGRPLLQPSGVQTAELSPDARLVATASFDGTARLFDVKTGQPAGPPLIHSARVRAARFRPDGRILATAGDDEAVRLWDVETGRPAGPPLPHGHWVVNLRFSPDGKKLLAGRVEGLARLWDLSNFRPIGEALAHPSRIPGHEVWCVEFTPDGRIAITGNGDGTVGFWDAETGRRIGDFVRLPAPIKQFLPDPTAEKLLVLADHRVHTLDRRSRREVAGPFGDQVLCIALSPDGRTVLAGDSGKVARLWDPASGHPIGPTMRHEGAVVGVAFRPDGSVMATVTSAGRIRFWDASTSKPIGPHLQHAGWITRFASDDRQPIRFSPDGRSLVSAGDSTVIWPVPAVSVEDDDRMTAWIPAVAGIRPDPQGDLLRLSPEEWSRDLSDQSVRLGHTTPVEPIAWHDRTAAHCEQFGPPTVALWHLDRLVATRPDDASLLMRRARVYRRLDDQERARVDEARAMRIQPSGRVREYQTHEWQDRAADAEAEGHWADALPCLTGLIDAIGPNVSLFRRRADVHAHLGHWSSAAADLETTIALSPPNFAGFGRALRRRFRTGAWGSDPDDPERLILYHLGAGDLDGYRGACAAIRRLVPPDADPALHLFLVYLVSRGPGGSADPSDLVIRAERAVRGLPEEEALSAQRFVGAALYRAGRFADAIERIERSCRTGGRDVRPRDWAFLAMAHHRLGDDQQARHCLGRLRAARPGAGPLRHLDELDLEVLRREAEAVVRLDPIFPADPFDGH
jgi:WD40 repeat protein/serine/threonine protein kinase/tetratricopeptide (TPR) repeat protein